MLVFIMLVGRSTLPILSKKESKGVAENVPPATQTLSTPSSLPLDKGETLTVTDLIWFLSLSTVSISLFGILQRFTGWHIGSVDWIALQTSRVTSFFTSPNAVGLFLGPILMLTLAVIARSDERLPAFGGTKQSPVGGIATPRFARLAMTIIAAFALAAILLSKSLGAIAAVGLGVLVLLFLMGYKKIVLILIMLTLLTTPYTIQLLTHKSQSTANRLTLWSYSWNYLSASPKNFIFGTGIRQFFRKIQKPYYDIKKMERLIYPHNIFLNFWTETGLVGMVSFSAIGYWLLAIGWKIYKHSDKLLGAALLASLVVLFTHITYF
jgi:O-antigen ligase